MPSQYTLVAKLFHWTIGVLILCMIGVGLYMESLPMGPDKIKLIGLHKSTGILILFLVALRLIWRLVHAVPALPADLPRVYHLVARAAHYALYALMFAMPISGWLMSSAAGFSVSVFGLFTLPDLLSPDKDLRKLFVQTHEYLAYTLMALLVLHVAAALWHHFARHDNVLRRMWFSKTA